MTNTLDGILASSAVPPWLPRAAQDARNFSFWAQILFFLSALLFFVWAIWTFATSSFYGINIIIWAGLYLVLAILCGLAGFSIKKSVIDEIDHGRFHEAKNNLIIWMIIGFAGFLITGVLLLLAYMKLNEAMTPQTPGYVPYAPGTVVAQQSPPPQYQPPAQAPMQQPQQPAPGQTYYQPPPAQPTSPDHRYQMMKCKNCGVQFPAFMSNCPNCGSPK